MINIKSFTKYKNIQFPLVACFIFCLICHIYILVNDLPNSDGLFYIDHNLNVISSGRFSLQLLGSFSSYITSPIVNGVLSITFLSLSFALIINILKITNKFIIVSLAFITAAFPTNASLFSFMYTADAYMLSLFLIIFSIYILEKKQKFSLILSVFLTAIALGTYQAYFAFAFGLVLLININSILVSNKVDCKKLMNDFLYLALSLIVYYLLLKLSLFLCNETLSGYQGINSMGTFNIKQIINGVLQCYFLDFNRTPIFVKSWFAPTIGMKILYFTLVASFISYFIVYTIKNIHLQINKLVIVGLTCLFPMALNVLYIIAPNSTVHSLMEFQYILCFFLVAIFVQRMINKKYIIAFTALILLIGYGYFVIDNIGYNYMNQRRNKYLASINRIVDRIETNEKFNGQTRLLILDIHNFTVGNSNSPTVLNDLYYVGGGLNYHTNKTLSDDIKYNIGNNFEIIEYAVDIVNESTLKEMPLWPKLGSVDIINDIIVVKFGDNY